MKVYVAALCGFLLATPALAQPSAPSGDNNASAPSENANGSGDHARAEPRQICRRIESDTSRRIGSRLVCHTAEEWRALQDNS